VQRQTQSGMGATGRIIIVVVLVILIANVLFFKSAKRSSEPVETPPTIAIGTESPPAENPTSPPAEAPQPQAIPLLVDLGAAKCIPCKMMAPILEELREQYKGKLKVIFIDVWKDEEAGRRYGIRMIPTQVFFDASGKEVFRHEGFFSKEDILGKWKELGFEFSEASS